MAQLHPDVRGGSPDSLWELLNLGNPDETAWMADGLCAQTDPEEFFPNKGSSLKRARSVCAACPVRAKCAAYALAHDERFGVWGGLSENQRRQIRPQHRSPVQPQPDQERAA